MKKDFWIILVIVIVLIAIIAAFSIYHSGSSLTSDLTTGAVTPAPSSGSLSGYSSTRTPAPANAVAPSEGSENPPTDTAVPSVQVAAAPGSSASYRSFNINISKNTYSPNTIIVNQGDTVNLEITAVDGNYGFTQPDYGFNVAIPKGKTQRIQFEALETGQFTFYCGACGGPSKGPVGSLIVTSQ